MIELKPCGECTNCCKTIGVAALQKAPGTWCQHCSIGKGCDIWGKPERPQECEDWTCAWRNPVFDALVDWERPDKMRMVPHVIEQPKGQATMVFQSTAHVRKKQQKIVDQVNRAGFNVLVLDADHRTIHDRPGHAAAKRFKEARN